MLSSQDWLLILLFATIKKNCKRKRKMAYCINSLSPKYSLLPGLNLDQVQAGTEDSSVDGFLWRLAEEGKDVCVTPQVGINSSLATQRCFPALEPIDLTCLLKRFAANDKRSLFGFDVTKQSRRVSNPTPTPNQAKCVFPNVMTWSLSLFSYILLSPTVALTVISDSRLPSCLPLWQK